MPLSTLELAQAREAVGELLDELQLDAYLFEIEPRDEGWRLTVECATDSGWETVTLPVPKDIVQAGRLASDPYGRLREDCRKRLAACKLQPGQAAEPG